MTKGNSGQDCIALLTKTSHLPCFKLRRDFASELETIKLNLGSDVMRTFSLLKRMTQTNSSPEVQASNKEGRLSFLLLFGPNSATWSRSMSGTDAFLRMLCDRGDLRKYRVVHIKFAAGLCQFSTHVVSSWGLLSLQAVQ